jgi:NAD(P)-dependent dehydrogenase (short-subunit alcohol dehydrogenase family)
MVQGVLQREGHVDFLFNNAGVGVGGEMDGYDRDDWDYVIDVNLRGVAYGIQAVYPSMVRRGSGHIVNTASMAGLITAPAQGVYTATKHAVVGVSKALRVEAARHGVRISVLCPGAIRTPILTGGVYGRTKLENATEEQLLKSWERVRPMPAGEFARRALDAVMRNDAIIVLPGWWKVFWYLERLSPALSMKLSAAAHKRLLAEVAESGLKFVPPKGED